MQKKSGIMKSGLDAMPLFLTDNLLKPYSFMGMITPLKCKACKKQYLFFKSSMHRQKEEQTYQTMNGRVEDCHESIFWTASQSYIYQVL